MSERTKIVELEKKIKKLESYVASLEKHITVDIRGIVLQVGDSLLSISSEDIILNANRNLNIISQQSTQQISGSIMEIKSAGRLDITSQQHLNVKGAIVNIN